MNVGTPERVAMKFTGHRSPSIFKRYHIVNLADMQEAARRLSAASSQPMLALQSGNGSNHQLGHPALPNGKVRDQE
jgi:hypothetical protein